MLAYYVEWHMRQTLKPLLFDDHDPAAAERQRPSVVRKAQRSPAARAKASSKRTADDLPVHSFRTLLADLGTPDRQHHAGGRQRRHLHAAHRADSGAETLLRTAGSDPTNVANSQHP